MHRLLLALGLLACASAPYAAEKKTDGDTLVVSQGSARVTLAEGLELNDAPRYRVRTLPAAGAILKDDDRAEQLTL